MFNKIMMILNLQIRLQEIA